MFTVGRETSISRDSRHGASPIQCSTPSPFLVEASLIRVAATAIICFSAADSGRTLSAKCSIVPILRDQSVQRLDQVPGRAVHAGLVARVDIALWPTSPTLTGRH